MPAIIDLTGQQFGRLTVIKRVPSEYATWWRCKCECGKYKNVPMQRLREQQTQSCGCLHLEAITKHGMHKSQIYKVWVNMHSRCNSTDPNYGGRGITVCKRWAKFEAFYEDMGDVPKGMTLDRKNTNGNYSKRNCRWATYTEQLANRRPFLRRRRRSDTDKYLVTPKATRKYI